LAKPLKYNKKLGEERGINMKKILVLLLLSTLILSNTACIDNMAASTNTVQTSQSTTHVVSTQTTNEISIKYDSDDINSTSDGSKISYIKLKGKSIIFDGSGATIHGSQIVITSAGTYDISGTLEDGQIIVNTGASEKVKLILSGATITCSTSAPIYALNAEKTVITLADNSKNYVTDGSDYILEDIASGEPNAAIFSNDDLTINGNGSLTVNANYNNGIQSKDDLKITGGRITVNAANDGIKGRDSVAIRDSYIIVESGGDGIQSNNDEDLGEGLVLIESGTVEITAGADGIQAETSLNINGGNIAISSGGGSANSSNKIGAQGNTWGNWGTINTSVDTPSAQGLKATTDVIITGGTITLDSSDDSIHSNNGVKISGGDIVLTSGDDGIHSDSSLIISGGDINIKKSYEGLESSAITINEGNIHIISSDDGINVVGGMDGSGMNGRPGQNNFNTSGSYYFNINGGYIFIDAMGDGLDINGAITMSGGKVLINGPTANDNGALDFTSFKITGGFLIAAGSSGMAQAPGTTSTQYSVMMNFLTAQVAGTMVHLESKDGQEVITFIPTKAYQSIVVSSPQLKNGSTYNIYTGGKSTGAATDGLFSGGGYTNGTQVTSFTISSITTTIGSTGMFPGGGGVPPRR
jgi:hypothetical protein